MSKGPCPGRKNPFPCFAGQSCSRHAGFTLVELLIVLVISALLASALGYAFTAGLTLQRHVNAQRAVRDQTDEMEQTLTRLLEGARLSADTNDQTTYFLGIADNEATPLGCDRLTWTTTAPGVPMAAMAATDDFETQQAARGPAGGIAEVSLSTAPVGDAGGQSGLFERLQRPSDADPTQGGKERLLDAQVTSIGFQFWDGQRWLPTWDTTASGRKLPQAVEVRYTVTGGSNNDVRTFIVPLPTSNAVGPDAGTPGGPS